MASSSHIEPGKQGKIIAKVGIKGKIGPISKTVKVFSNDPTRPVVTLVLKGVIKTNLIPRASSASPTTPILKAKPASPAPHTSLPMSGPPRVTE